MQFEEPLDEVSFKLDGKRLFDNSVDSYGDGDLPEATRSLHPIVESCLRNTTSSAKGNLFGGGLGASVYLRIKLSERQNWSSDASSKEWLESALELVESSLPTEAAAPIHSHDSCESSHHLGLLSNSLIGSRCLLASVLQRLGRTKEAHEAATCVLDMLSELSSNAMDDENPNHDCDCSLLFGLAGGLQVIWFLRQELCEPALGKDLALKLTYGIFLEGLHEQPHSNHKCNIAIESESKTDFCLQWNWNGWPYLGAATGSLGILHALLGHTQGEWEELEETLPNAKWLVQTAIDELANHRYNESLPRNSVSGRGNLKDSTIGFEPDESQSACDWTHGAPGYCLLLLQAFDVFGDERYFFHARDLAESVVWARWQNYDEKVLKSSNNSSHVGLAKGISGIAYLFLAMARVDWRDRIVWMERAKKLATMAVSEASNDDKSIHSNTSLFGGIGGLASLLVDLEVASHEETDSLPCYFPFFESCQVNSNPRNLEYKTRPEDHFFVAPETMAKTMNERQTIGKSPAMTTKSTAETAITLALTDSMSTTQTPIMIRSHSDTKQGCIASALDVSQLTEPSAIEATFQRLPRVAHSPMQPTILEFSQAAPKPIHLPAHSVTKSSLKAVSSQQRPPQTKAFRRSVITRPLSCPDQPTESQKARTRASRLCRIHSEKRHAQKHNFHYGDEEEEASGDDSAFMTDSVKRIQRAEASWIKHFGTQHEKARRNQSFSPGASASFRRAVGAFSGLSNEI